MPVQSITERLPKGDLSALLRVSLALAETLDLDEVLKTAIEGAVEVLGLGTGAIYRIVGEDLYLGATTPALPSDFPDELRRAPLRDHPHIVEAITTSTPVFIPDISSASLTPAERVAADARHLRSILYVPLIVKGRAEGVVIVGTQDAMHEFSDEDVDLCRTLSAQIALAINNARLYESAEIAASELSCAYDATLEGWSLALELRDEETRGHTERAAALAIELASRLGVPEGDLAHIRRGALLHDIGKMAVPDTILRKPGALTADEWVVMRKHPEYAREFLSHIEYLAPALDIPYCHHERWDGSGYPRGLEGENIPLSARIFAVIDVYDALTSDRPYRTAWSEEDALAHIRHQAGEHFDPAVVQAFMACIDHSLDGQ